MTVLGFTVAFHGPFRVGSAYARDGIDAALDAHDPLPADHLKGVMRAAAVSLLGQHRTVTEVFGSPAAPSPWSWSSATLDGQPGQQWQISTRHRVAIDPDRHRRLHRLAETFPDPAGGAAIRAFLGFPPQDAAYVAGELAR